MALKREHTNPRSWESFERERPEIAAFISESLKNGDRYKGVALTTEELEADLDKYENEEDLHQQG